MSRIPVDLPPDTYPPVTRPSRKDNGMLLALVVFAVFFALTCLALEFL